MKAGSSSAAARPSFAWCLLALALAVGACWPAAARAGMVVRVTDPRYFQKAQRVVFPGAEVKLVLLEFEAVAGDPGGKQRARELHDAYLARIQGLAGGAVVTYVTGEGQRIANFRVEAELVARQQGAAMALWGRVLVDAQGRSRLAARLWLVQPPPGLEARYRVIPSVARAVPTEVLGTIQAPAAQTRIDFAPIAGDVTVLAPLLSGLAHYYKGAVREGEEAAPWLAKSVSELGEYVARVPESADAAALAQAHLFLARALVRLAEARPAEERSDLQAAEQHAAAAARLNPYDPSVPSAQAVIAQRAGAAPAVLRARLAEAVRLAPADATARVNLAVLDAALGNGAAALHTIDQAKHVQRILGQQEPLEQRQIENDIRRSH